MMNFVNYELRDATSELLLPHCLYTYSSWASYTFTA